jgi:hypothetical protein
MTRVLRALTALVLLGATLGSAHAGVCTGTSVQALSQACRDAVRDLCPRGFPIESTFCAQGALAGCADCEGAEAACVTALGTSQTACLTDCRTTWLTTRAGCGPRGDTCRLRANLAAFACKRRCARDAATALGACSQQFVDCVDACLPK